MELTTTEFNTGGGITLLLLLFGLILTVITIRCMVTGRITLPRWGKVLLSIAMITWLLFMLLMMLPPMKVDNIFVDEYTEIITSVDPSIGE